MATDELKALAHNLIAAHAVADGDPDAVAEILALGSRIELKVGDTLEVDAGGGQGLCFLLEGRMRIERPGAAKRVLGSIKAPAIQGQLALMGQQAPAATGVAEMPGLAIRIPAATARSILAGVDSMGNNLRWLLIASLCRQLGAVTELLATLLWEQGKVAAHDIDRLDGVLANCERGSA